MENLKCSKQFVRVYDEIKIMYTVTLNGKCLYQGFDGDQVTNIQYEYEKELIQSTYRFNNWRKKGYITNINYIEANLAHGWTQTEWTIIYCFNLTKKRIIHSVTDYTKYIYFLE